MSTVIVKSDISILDAIDIFYNNFGKIIIFRTIDADGDGVNRQIYNSIFIDAIDKRILVKNGIFVDIANYGVNIECGCKYKCVNDDNICGKTMFIFNFYSCIGMLFVGMINAECKNDLHLSPKIIAEILNINSNITEDDTNYLVKNMDPILYENSSKINDNDYFDVTLEFSSKFEYFKHLLCRSSESKNINSASFFIAIIIKKYYVGIKLSAYKIDSDFSGQYIINSADVISCFTYDNNINDIHKKNIQDVINKLDSDKLKLLLNQLTNSCSVNDPIRIGILPDNNCLDYNIQTCFKSIDIKNEILSDNCLFDNMVGLLTVPNDTIKDIILNQNLVRNGCNRRSGFFIVSIDEQRIQPYLD